MRGMLVSRFSTGGMIRKMQQISSAPASGRQSPAHLAFLNPVLMF
jgi:hypothetical protein